MNRLQQIQQTNLERYHRWMDNSPGWNILEAAAECAGEVGEMLNICKKLRRSELGITGNKEFNSELLYKLEGEIGDVLITLCIVASRAGIDLDKAVTKSFNLKSAERGFPERI